MKNYIINKLNDVSIVRGTFKILSKLTFNNNFGEIIFQIYITPNQEISGLLY